MSAPHFWLPSGRAGVLVQLLLTVDYEEMHFDREVFSTRALSTMLLCIHLTLVLTEELH